MTLPGPQAPCISKDGIQRPVTENPNHSGVSKRVHILRNLMPWADAATPPRHQHPSSPHSFTLCPLELVTSILTFVTFNGKTAAPPPVSQEEREESGKEDTGLPQRLEDHICTVTALRVTRPPASFFLRARGLGK